MTPPVTAADTRLLEGLPIPAAIVVRREGALPAIIQRNAAYRALAARPVADGQSLLELPVVRAALAQVLGGKAVERAFEAAEDDELSGRHFSIKLARLPDVADGVPACLLSVVDRTAEKRNERNLRTEMLRDSLTGLPNRVAFSEAIEAALDGRAAHAVLVVDVNRFSRINESMGALTGDELLITFARRLLSGLRSGDLLARTGGNEFGVLLQAPGGLADALAAADRIGAALAAPFRMSEMEIRVDCAVGCALVEAGGEGDPETLFRNAQFACKQAKLAGEPQVYEPREASAARRRFSLETDLRRALDRDELTLAFQPLIELSSSRVAGFEALARWHHPVRGPIPPAEFIQVAEESGLILHLGRWALDAAARTATAWDRQVGRELPLYVSVNVSPIQIARDNVAAAVSDAMRASGLSGRRMSFELTENAIVREPARAAKVLNALKGLNASVAMDDFGTGYSSLAYLQRLPIDVLKIDRSFISGMLDDEDSVSIVRAVLGLAEALGMQTTAEGIESAELAARLNALGCTYGQGFYHARPLSATAALDYWLDRNAPAS